MQQGQLGPSRAQLSRSGGVACPADEWQWCVQCAGHSQSSAQAEEEIPVLTTQTGSKAAVGRDGAGGWHAPFSAISNPLAGSARWHHGLWLRSHGRTGCPPGPRSAALRTAPPNPDRTVSQPAHATPHHHPVPACLAHPRPLTCAPKLHPPTHHTPCSLTPHPLHPLHPPTPSCR